MTLYFTIPDARPDWFADVLRCAEKRSGLPVRVVDTMSDRFQFFYDQLLAARNTPEEGPGMRRFCALGLLRWPMLLEAVRDLPESDWPICCLDWDILVCEDLRPWLEKFKLFNYSITKDKNGLPAAPYLLRDIRPLRTFCDALESSILNSSPSAAWNNDMHAWARMNDFHSWSVGDMSVITDGRVLDHNLGEPSSAHFVMDGDHKKVLFENGHAYFFTQDGARVETVALHCWSAFKEKIPDYIKALGV